MMPSMILDTFRPEFPSLTEHMVRVSTFLQNIAYSPQGIFFGVDMLTT
jgi:hypothetical protein